MLVLPPNKITNKKYKPLIGLFYYIILITRGFINQRYITVGFYRAAFNYYTPPILLALGRANGFI